MSTAKKESPKKPSSFTWEIEGSDYVRKIQFKKLGAEEKVGFGLGGKGQRCEVVAVTKNSQSYWRGIETGYKIVSVNGKDVNEITVTPALREATTSGKDFVVGMQVPDKPDWPDKGKDDGTGDPQNPASGANPDDALPSEKAEKPVVEYAFEKKEAEKEERPIIDNNAGYGSGGFDGDGDEFWPSSKIGDPIKASASKDEMEAFNAKEAAAAAADAAAKDVLPKKEEDSASKKNLADMSKEELEEAEKAQKAEIDRIEKESADLHALIKKKELELKERASREVLSQLKNLRRQHKELKDKMRLAMEELERIRALLRAKLAELEASMKGLAAGAAARDAKLTELEAQVRAMTKNYSKQ